MVQRTVIECDVCQGQVEGQGITLDLGPGYEALSWLHLTASRHENVVYVGMPTVSLATGVDKDVCRPCMIKALCYYVEMQEGARFDGRV